MKPWNNDSGEALGRILLRIMLVFLALMPFCYSCIEIFSSMRGCWDRNGVLYILSITAVIVVGIIAISRLIPTSIDSRKKIVLLFALFSIAFVCRTFVSVLMQATPVSDFSRCFRYAVAQTNKDEEFELVKYPYLGAYAVSLKLFFNLFPMTLFSAQVMNALVASLTAIVLYLATEEMIANSKTALISGLMYAVYPGLVTYSSITSCEHFSQLFFTLGLYFLARARNISCSNKIKNLFYTILSGVSLGLMCLYKELYIIVVPALLVAGLCYDILPVIIRKIKTHEKKSGLCQAILKTIFLAITILCVYKASVAAVQYEICGTTYNRNTPISVVIYQGLAIESGGEWNASVKEYCSQVMEKSSTASEVNRALFDKLSSEYQGDIGKLCNVILRKIRIDFCDEGVYWYWTFSDSGKNLLQKTWVGELLFSLFPSAFFMFMCGIMAIGLLLQAFRHKVGGFSEFFVTGVVFLFVLMLMLIEAQGRYKSNIMPYICILYAFSCEAITYQLDRIWKKIKSLYMYIHSKRKEERV